MIFGSPGGLKSISGTVTNSRLLVMGLSAKDSIILGVCMMIDLLK